MGLLGHRFFAVLIAIAVCMLLPPSELLAADAPTSVSCGQSDEIVLHNPPRPAILARHHGTALDERGQIDTCGPAELVERLGLAAPSTSPVSCCAARPSMLVATCRGRPPARAPPAVRFGATASTSRIAFAI